MFYTENVALLLIDLALIYLGWIGMKYLPGVATKLRKNCLTAKNKMQNIKSLALESNTSIPQLSILGPFLLVLYVNDYIVEQNNISNICKWYIIITALYKF